MSRYRANGNFSGQADRIKPPSRRSDTIPIIQVLQWLYHYSGGQAGNAAAEFRVEDHAELVQTLQEISEISSRGSLQRPEQRRLRMLVQRALRLRNFDGELCKLALTDDLTGLYNRRAFFALGDQQLKHCRRDGDPALVLFADVDGLKRINDEGGHNEGDQVLLHYAQILKNTFRDSDIVARLGGDEFAVFASFKKGDAEQACLRRLGARLSEETPPNSCGYSGSLSVGVARFDPEACQTLPNLLAAADHSMYKYKRESAATQRSSLRCLEKFAIN